MMKGKIYGWILDTSYDCHFLCLSYSFMISIVEVGALSKIIYILGIVYKEKKVEFRYKPFNYGWAPPNHLHNWYWLYKGGFRPSRLFYINGILYIVKVGGVYCVLVPAMHKC
jgi:hypothetical protein